MTYKFTWIRCFFLVCIVPILISGCAEKPKVVELTTEYQVVFLDNGQAFFGKLENPDAPYLLLKDIFYIQQQENKETHEVKSILIKRGNEWHGPDRMYINTKHIVLIEPVNPTSRVAGLIKEAKQQKTGGK